MEPATEIGVKTPLPAPPASGQTIAVLTGGDQSSTAIADAIKEVAKQVGWEVVTIGFKQDQPQTVVTALEQVLSLNPKPVATTVTSVSPEVWQSVIPDFEEAGVAIIPIGTTGIEAQPAVPTGDFLWGGDTQEQRGEQIGNYIVASSGGKAKVVAIDSPDIPIFGKYNEGIKKALDACAGCSMTVENVSTKDLFTNGAATAASIAQRSADADWLSLPFGSVFVGLRNSLEAAGRGDIHVTSSSCSQENLQDVKDGKVDACLVTAAKYFGYVTMDAAFRIVQKAELPLAEYTVMPQQIFTEENTEETISDYFQPEDIPQRFNTLWGLK
ncbi:sugar ABC transporter substrate-binding protein [Nocardioides sp. WS12]|uniref:sugar ABC transporter substrate-binding protein n=1 Tax=Nocardioides sp. WS12 TaxID=2486272 RepID=UPI0015FBC7E4|nr:sugar ABC transporter substrate-binding protein [Nocardioides sp. WS12]